MPGSVCLCMRTMEECGLLVVFRKEHKIITIEINDNDYIYIHI